MQMLYETLFSVSEDISIMTVQTFEVVSTNNKLVNRILDPCLTYLFECCKF